MPTDALVALIRTRMLACQQVALEGLRRDLGAGPADAKPIGPTASNPGRLGLKTAVGRNAKVS